ncbi:hypothetical protein FHX08_000608 [Rhizobium sp. BK529]|uniref:hypothetical protein n=1 Tax=Rhizobium sp. BK529 TaxID=2586983 RepID=UPI00160E6915|nr:hypothetical protein [Rhizobium sp. BK529]MBB3590264.1 hypothetical protein [Rhizobium sp. BK529]
MSETNPVNGIAAMLAKFQSLGRKSDAKRLEGSSSPIIWQEYVSMWETGTLHALHAWLQ